MAKAFYHDDVALAERKLSFNVSLSNSCNSMSVLELFSILYLIFFSHYFAHDLILYFASSKINQINHRAAV